MRKYIVIALFFIISFFSCGDEPGGKNNKYIISILHPTEDSVVKDSVLIDLDFQDESIVLKVELWMNGDSTGIADYTSPFSLILNTKNYSNGPNSFFVRLYTLDGEVYDSEDISFTISNFLVFSTLFGSTEKNESGHSIIQKQDSNFVVLGNVDNDVLMLELNNKGDVLWSQSYGGSQLDEAYHFEHTSDGGYIISGSTQSYGFGGSDIWLIKSGSNGLIEWNIYIGTEYDEQGGKIIQTEDNGYLVVGNRTHEQRGDSDVWLIKTNSQGDSTWTKTYGGLGDDIGSDIIQIENNGYILVGSTKSYEEEDYDILIVKIDDSGNEEWVQSYGIGSNDFGQAILESRNGGYMIQFLVEGYGNGNTSVGLLRIDLNGNLIWSKAFGGTINTKSRMFSTINSSEYISVCSQINYSTNSSNAWLIKINDNGEIIWEKTFGKYGEDAGFSVIPTLDSGFIITGKSNSLENNNENLFDLWILKTDSNGYSKFD